MGGKISPSAVLINKNGTKLVNVKNQDAITKILDMVRIWQINLQERHRTMRIPLTISSILDQEEKKKKWSNHESPGVCTFWIGGGMLIQFC